MLLFYFFFFFFFNDTATTEIYTLSLHDALPISGGPLRRPQGPDRAVTPATRRRDVPKAGRTAARDGRGIRSWHGEPPATSVAAVAGKPRRTKHLHTPFQSLPARRRDQES